MVRRPFRPLVSVHGIRAVAFSMASAAAPQCPGPAALEPVWLAVKACVRFVVRLVLRLAMLEPFAAMSPSTAAKSAEPSRTDALHLNRFDV